MSCMCGDPYCPSCGTAQGTYRRREVEAGVAAVAGKQVYKARMKAPNDDGWMFFTAKNYHDAGKRRDELGLVGLVRRATHNELTTIAARALDDV